MIPRIIHQTWKTAALPEAMAASRQSWIENHPGWEYRLWTDEDIDRLARENFPELLELFRSYKYQIQRVDAVRYMFLNLYGGVYVDLDVFCQKPLDDLLDHGVVLPLTHPIGFSNDFMMAEKGHGFTRFLLDKLPDASRQWDKWYVPRHFRVLLTTGSLFISLMYNLYPLSETVTPLPWRLYNGQSPASYVSHGQGDTWAGWDFHLFNMLIKHKTAAAFGLVALCAALIWALFR